MFEEYIERIRKSPYIDNEIMTYITSENKKFIYGVGLQASVCLGIFRDMDLKIEGIILPNGSEIARFNGYWGELLSNVNKYILDEFNWNKSNVDILLAIDRNRYTSAKQILYKQGFENIYTCCWERNIYMKEICYEIYLNKIKDK